MIWQKFLDDGQIPLVKILTLGDVSGEFQFAHLSFQESLFSKKLESGELSGFWDEDRQLCERLNDPFYRNAFTLGRGHHGKGLALLRSSWSFSCQPRLSELGRQGLKSLVAGATQLRVLDLSAVILSAPGDLSELAAGAGEEGWPELLRLCLRWCRLPAEAASGLNRMLLRSPKLVDLDLESNRDVLHPDATQRIAELGCDLCLERISLRWCHTPVAAAPGIAALLARCPNLREVDLLGNRGFSRELLGSALPASVQLKGVDRRR